MSGGVKEARVCLPLTASLRLVLLRYHGLTGRQSVRRYCSASCQPWAIVEKTRQKAETAMNNASEKG
jgi:hypothetical protein